jgi:O-antigen/teichoic acid export membrane protein
MSTSDAPVMQPSTTAQAEEAKSLSSFLFLLRVRAVPLFYSVSDQALSVGGMFLANVALARVRSKEEYGAFALSYSIYTFISGLHNAAILEPFTVLGSGRYHKQLSSIARLMWRSNLVVCGGLSAFLLAAWFLLHYIVPTWATPALLGMAVGCGALLTGTFVRRAYYIERRPKSAAFFSFLFVVALLVILSAALHWGWLSGLTTFLVGAAAWCVAITIFRQSIPGRNLVPMTEPPLRIYWDHHWRYARWVLATAFLFQLLTQGYYWIVAGFLSVRDVAGLRAMHILVTPVDQIFTALNFLILPMMATRFATRQLQALMSLWNRFTLAFLAITTGFALTVHMLRLQLLHLIYGGKYDDLSYLLGILVLAPVIMGIGNSTNAVLKSIERPDAVFLAYFASGLITLTVGIPLVTRYGLPGAVYGMLASSVTYTGVLLCQWLIHRKRMALVSSSLRS